MLSTSPVSCLYDSVSWAESRKRTSTILMENCDQPICLALSIQFLYVTLHKVCLSGKFVFELKVFSDHSKINHILVRQLKSLQEMVSSADLAILISWYPICLPLILVSTSMKIVSTSATVMHREIRDHLF